MLVRGTRYYRFLGKDNLEMFTINRIKSDGVSIINTDGTFGKKTKEEIEYDYIKLTPDGYMNFSIVSIGTGKDILVTLLRKDNKDGTPNAVCRQFVGDIFSNMMNKNPKNEYIGVSINQETCPTDVDYKTVLYCDGIDINETIAVYIDDTLDDILSRVNTNKYNVVLSNIYNSIDNNNKTISKDPLSPYKYILGCSRDLDHLLRVNNFLYDFYKVFNIEKLDFELLLVDRAGFNKPYIHEDQLPFFERLMRHNIQTTFVYDFSKDIDLKALANPHILIADRYNKLFVVEIVYHNSNQKILEDIHHRYKYALDYKVNQPTNI